MKGPGLRRQNDLDRVWECPACGHRERTGGVKTTVACPKCQRPEAGGKTNFMKLVSSPPTAPRRTFMVVSNTPTPVPVASILGEDAPRATRKQSLRPTPTPETPLTEDAAPVIAPSPSPESTNPSTNTSQNSPTNSPPSTPPQN